MRTATTRSTTAKQPSQELVVDRQRGEAADGRTDHAAGGHQHCVARPDRASPVVRPGADHRGRNDDDQGRALRHVLVEAEQQHHRRHEQDAAANPQQAGEEPRRDADGQERQQGERIGGHQRSSMRDGDDDQEDAEDAGQERSAEPMHEQRAPARPDQAAGRQHHGRAEVDAVGPAEEDRADDGDRHDRRQRRRLRAVLAEPGHDERGHHHDPAADAEEPAQHAGRGADRREQEPGDSWYVGRHRADGRTADQADSDSYREAPTSFRKAQDPV